MSGPFSTPLLTRSARKVVLKEAGVRIGNLTIPDIVRKKTIDEDQKMNDEYAERARAGASADMAQLREDQGSESGEESINGSENRNSLAIGTPQRMEGPIDSLLLSDSLIRIHSLQNDDLPEPVTSVQPSYSPQKKIERLKDQMQIVNGALLSICFEAPEDKKLKAQFNALMTDPQIPHHAQEEIAALFETAKQLQQHRHLFGSGMTRSAHLFALYLYIYNENLLTSDASHRDIDSKKFQVFCEGHGISAAHFGRQFNPLYFWSLRFETVDMSSADSQTNKNSWSDTLAHFLIYLKEKLVLCTKVEIVREHIVEKTEVIEAASLNLNKAETEGESEQGISKIKLLMAIFKILKPNLTDIDEVFIEALLTKNSSKRTKEEILKAIQMMRGWSFLRNPRNNPDFLILAQTDIGLIKLLTGMVDVNGAHGISYTNLLGKATSVESYVKKTNEAGKRHQYREVANGLVVTVALKMLLDKTTTLPVFLPKYMNDEILFKTIGDDAFVEAVDDKTLAQACKIAFEIGAHDVMYQIVKLNNKTKVEFLRTLLTMPSDVKGIKHDTTINMALATVLLTRYSPRILIKTSTQNLEKEVERENIRTDIGEPLVDDISMLDNHSKEVMAMVENIFDFDKSYQNACQKLLLHTFINELAHSIIQDNQGKEKIHHHQNKEKLISFIQAHLDYLKRFPFLYVQALEMAIQLNNTKLIEVFFENGLYEGALTIAASIDSFGVNGRNDFLKLIFNLNIEKSEYLNIVLDLLLKHKLYEGLLAECVANNFPIRFINQLLEIPAVQAEIDQPDNGNNGVPPLAFAIAAGNIEIVKILLENGANFYVALPKKDNKGRPSKAKTAYALAEKLASEDGVHSVANDIFIMCQRARFASLINMRADTL